MTDHLPECQRAYKDHLHRCICKYVRACEQRVLAEREADGPWFRSVVHDCCVDKQTAYAAGLDAAREAVADLPYEEFTGDLEGIVWIDQEQVIAAIDALRGEA